MLRISEWCKWGVRFKLIAGRVAKINRPKGDVLWRSEGGVNERASAKGPAEMLLIWRLTGRYRHGFDVVRDYDTAPLT